MESYDDMEYLRETYSGRHPEHGEADKTQATWNTTAR
jgi:hypothetical protein